MNILISLAYASTGAVTGVEPAIDIITGLVRLIAVSLIGIAIIYQGVLIFWEGERERVGRILVGVVFGVGFIAASRPLSVAILSFAGGVPLGQGVLGLRDVVGYLLGDLVYHGSFLTLAVQGWRRYGR